MDSDTGAIASAAADAAAAEVIAEQAEEQAAEALEVAEEAQAEEQALWTMTEQRYTECLGRLETVELKLQELMSTPIPVESQATPEGSEPPELEVEVAEPTKQEKRRGMALTRQTRAIRFG